MYLCDTLFWINLLYKTMDSNSSWKAGHVLPSYNVSIVSLLDGIMLSTVRIEKLNSAKEGTDKELWMCIYLVEYHFHWSL